MFRSMSNFKGMTFDEDEEDPGSCISNAAMGFHNEEMSSFLTTSIPHDKKEKFEFRISPYGSMDNLVDDKVNPEIQRSDDKTSPKSPQKKIEPETLPSKLTANDREIRLKRQELSFPMYYGLTKSPASRRNVNRGISLDSYHSGEYFQDNYGNIFVHKLLPRATTFDASSDVSSVVNPKVFDFLKSSIKKWKQNIKAKNRQQNDSQKNEISCAAVEKECSYYVESPCGTLDKECFNCMEIKSNKRLHKSKLQRTKKLFESDLEVTQDSYCYSENHPDKDVTGRCKMQNMKSKNSKWKQDKGDRNFKSIVEIPQAGQSKYKSFRQLNSIGKNLEDSNDNNSFNSVGIDQERAQIPVSDSSRVRKLKKEKDTEAKLLQKRLSTESKTREYIKPDLFQPRIPSFTNQSVRYFTVIEDDKKKYVSSLNFNLK